MTPIAARLAALDWGTVTEQLDAVGSASLGALLGGDETGELAAMFDDDRRFRSSVDMARHRYGSGRYRYFAHPLPPLVSDATAWRRRTPRRGRRRRGRPSTRW